MKKYSIKEISIAWTKFTQPTWLVNAQKEIKLEDLKNGGMVEYETGIKLIEIDYSRWIPYLISEEWKK